MTFEVCGQGYPLIRIEADSLEDAIALVADDSLTVREVPYS